MGNSFVQKFVFDKLPARGAFVVLNDTWQIISAQKIYPDDVQRILGELLAANVLITTSLKFNGKVIIQIQDNPKIDLVVSECSNEFNVRATAKFSSVTHNDYQINYSDCIEAGRLVISIDSQNDSGNIYQSIVALTGIDLADALDEYMLQSEQLRTIFVLAYSKSTVMGFMLQELPDVENHYMDEIDRLFILADTLTQHELMNEEISILLHKIFPIDDIILFDPHPVNSLCRCSRENVANMLRALGKEEAESIIKERSKIEVTCDFCNFLYTFDALDIHNIFYLLDPDAENISNEVH
ncbi:MAG: Hsp33 family molecular chaperone HslO [Neisseriaceae bacterium]